MTLEVDINQKWEQTVIGEIKQQQKTHLVEGTFTVAFSSKVILENVCFQIRLL